LFSLFLNKLNELIFLSLYISIFFLWVGGALQRYHLPIFIILFNKLPDVMLYKNILISKQNLADITPKSRKGVSASFQPAVQD